MTVESSNFFEDLNHLKNLEFKPALKFSSDLCELWSNGGLPQKRKIQDLVFPSGIGYDKSINRVQTKRVNSIFKLIPSISDNFKKIKSGEKVDLNQFSAKVTSKGSGSNFIKDLEAFLFSHE